MFTTKQQVDKHVEAILRKRSSDVERKKQGYAIASQYVKVKDYQTALRYLDGFLSVCPDYDKAYVLRGEIYEALNEPQKAIESYKSSLKLNEHQRDILVKVCRLFCEVGVDAGSVQYWADKLEKVYPSHEVLFKLREKICASQGTEENIKELESLYTTELSRRPDDTRLHIKLLELYLKQRRVNEAYMKAVREETSGLLKGSLDWYKCLVNVYQKYKAEFVEQINGDFHMQLLWAQCQLVQYSLENARVGDCVEALKNFDQTLFSTMNLTATSDSWSVFQQEMMAQLHFLSGVLLLKKAKDGCLANSEASKLSAPCFILSYAVLQPNIKAAWYVQSSSELKEWYRRWHDVGCFRVCQSGHMMRCLASLQLQDWLNEIQEELCNVQGKQRLFEVIFQRAHVSVDKSKSYLYNNSQLTTFSPRLPTEEDLMYLDQATEHLHPDSVHYIIWRALQYYNIREETQPDYNIHLFDNIQYGNLKLDIASPDTLCRLDIEAFVYAAVFDVANHLQVALSEHGVPRVLPVIINNPLGSQTQREWWSAVYQLAHGTNKKQQGELRHILQTGLEKIRLIGKHGLDATTMMHLARTFTKRAREDKAPPSDVKLIRLVDDHNALQARIEHYWRGAIKDLEDLQCNKNMTPPRYQLFTNRDKQLSDDDINTHLTQARYELALFLMEDQQYEEAIAFFSKVPWPEAVFEEAMCYKHLAVTVAEKMFGNIIDEEYVTERALLEKVLDRLKLVLDQLGADHKHPLYSKAAEEYEKVALDLEQFNYRQDETSFVADPALNSSYINKSSALAVSGHRTPNSQLMTSKSALYSSPASDRTMSYSQRTPVRRPQPSPDRLDIQLQMLSRSNKEMLQEFQKSRKTLNRMESRVEMLENSSRKLDENLYRMTKEFGELQTSLQNIMKQVEAVENAYTKSDKEVNVLRRYEEETRQEIKSLKDDQRNQLQLLRDEVNKLVDVVKSMQELQKASVTLPHHLQQAQAGGMMLPPGGLPAFYGPSFRPQRGMVAPHYPGGYGSGYMSEYDYSYAQRFVPPMVPSQYVAPGHSAHERSQRDTIPEALHAVDNEYEENGYGDEAADGFYEQEDLVRQRQTYQTGVSGGVTSQHIATNITTSSAPVCQVYGQSGNHHQIPGPGFFSASDVPVPHTSNVQTVAHPVIDLSEQGPVTTSTQAVSVASVSGSNLFMMPKGQISTSFPLPMPGAAKPPDISALTSTVTQPPSVVKSPDKSVEECDKETDGEVTTPETSFNDYKPLVSLPEVITKSGEEEETVMFSDRAKLYRFVEKQWKERGVGTIKILHNEEKGTVRILMRRDQVLKVCANHRIKADMDIDYKDTNDKKTLTWRATDYTEEEPRLEQFCCRFKTPELALDFKESFQKAKLIAKKNATPKKGDTTNLEASTASESFSTTKQSSRPAFGSTSSASKSVFSFGASTFGTMPTTSGASVQLPFGQKSSENEEQGKQNSFGGFTFTTPPCLKDTFSSQAKAKSDDLKQGQKDDKPKPFADFTFGSSPQKPGLGTKLELNLTTSGMSAAERPAFESLTKANQKQRESDKNRSEQNVDSKAVVNLAAGTNLIAQGENEESLFGERVKLYILDLNTKDWKEKAIGEIQILKNNITGKYRILMYREQMLMVCADHLITRNMKLLPKDGSQKSWCWSVEECTGEKPCIKQFAVQFKTEEAASGFKKVFDECISALSVASGQATATNTTPSLASQFKKTPGEWVCDGCYVVNKPEHKRCVACETLKPGTKDEPADMKTTSSITLSKAGGFQFSGSVGKPFSFGERSLQQDATVTSTVSTFSFGNVAFDLSKFGAGSDKSEAKTGNEPVTKTSEVAKDETLSDAAKPRETEDISATNASASNLKSNEFKFGSGGGFNFRPSIYVFSGGKFTFGQTPNENSSSGSEVERSGAKEKASNVVSSVCENVDGKSGPKQSTVDKVGIQQKPSKTPTTPLSPGDEGYYINQEGEDDHIYFTPVVKLPENIEIKTGEEEEELLYYQRAKLYRFINNEWKERGIGEVRILRHKVTGKTRILMRRDQVLKICMNHAITKDLELKPMLNSKGKAWVWHAEDFTEDKLSHEQFAIRFTSPEIANKFKEVFDASRDDPKSLDVVEHTADGKHSKSELISSPAKSEHVTAPVMTVPSFSSKLPDSKPFVTSPVFGGKSSSAGGFGQFKPQVFGSSKLFEFKNSSEVPFESVQDKSGKGSKECGLLAKLLSGPTEDTSTETVSSDKKEDAVIIIKEEEVPEDKLEEARKWQLPDSFYLYENRPPCKGCLGCLTDDFDFSTIGSDKTVKIPKQKVKPAEKGADTKDQVSSESKKEDDSTSGSEAIKFGNASSFGDFAALAAKAGNTFAFGKGSDSKSAGWAGAGTALFSSAVQKKQNQTEGDDDNEDVEESPDIHFEPIVQLPEVVDLKTGEEEEEKLFCQRAKLYRFDNGQWKERGVGEMKILKNTNTGRFRLLLRREQVLKVACNHYLTADMVLKPLQTSETAWCWYAVDHTENEPKNEQFALRFKTKELAAVFRDKFVECQEELRARDQKCSEGGNKHPAENSLTETQLDEESDDCESNEGEPLFSKRATMYYLEDDNSCQQVGLGELVILHDEDVGGARIRMKSDQNNVVCNHIICRTYELNCDAKKKCCDWVALDFTTDEPKHHHFKVQFSSASAAEEFKQAFDKGLEIANTSCIDEIREGVSLSGELTKPQIASCELSE